MVIIAYMGEKSNSNPTQCTMVLDYIQKHGSITPRDAEEMYGIMRLGARIYELKKKGYRIKTELTEGKNRFGQKTRYARYSIERSNNE